MGQGIGPLVIFLIVTLLGTLWLEQTLSRYVALELALIAVLVLVGLVMLFGAATNSGWAWPLSVLFFAVSVANISLIYWVAQEAFLQYVVLLGWITLALIFSATRIGSEQTTVNQHGEQVRLEDIMPDPKYRETKISTKKTSKKRKSKKRKKR